MQKKNLKKKLKKLNASFWIDAEKQKCDFFLLFCNTARI